MVDINKKFIVFADVHIEGYLWEHGDKSARVKIENLLKDMIEDLSCSLPGHIGLADAKIKLIRRAEPHELHWFKTGPIWQRAS